MILIKISVLFKFLKHQVFTEFLPNFQIQGISKIKKKHVFWSRFSIKLNKM